MTCLMGWALRIRVSTTTLRTRSRHARPSRPCLARRSARISSSATGTSTWFYLLMLEGEKVFKTKDLSKQLGVARLSFADAEQTARYLDITPGSVSVLGLMNDAENHVQLVIDKPIAESRMIGCHPCINSSTLAIATHDVLDKILPAVHHEAIMVDLPEPEEA